MDIDIKNAVSTKEQCEFQISLYISALYDALMENDPDEKLAEFVLPSYQRNVSNIIYSGIILDEDCLYIEYNYNVHGNWYKSSTKIPLVYFNLDSAMLGARVRNAIKYKDELNAIKDASEILKRAGIESLEEALKIEKSVK